MLRLLKRLIIGSVIVLVTTGLLYSFTDGFGQRWRDFVIGKFEERRVYMDFDRLGVSLVDGLVARHVNVYGDKERKQLLMAVDRLNLDIDYGKLLKKQFFIEGLELSDTSVSLPMDPDHASGDHLDLKRFSARVFMLDDRMEIRRAEGELAGLHLVISGALKLPQKLTDRTKRDKKDPKSKTPAFVLTHEHRELIQRGVRWLDRFSFKGGKPTVAVDIDGNLDEPDEVRAAVKLSARKVGYESYVCEELTGSAEYHDHVLDIRSLTLRDRLGTFEASATWPLEADEVQFTVNSSADLPQLARSFFQSDELREIVFYESVPNLSLEGKWFIRGTKATPRRPVEALGRLKFGRFATRGEVFEGLSANFGVSPDGYYIRDGLLRHKTGTMSLQAMSKDDEGFKYRTVMRMDPHAFLAFVPAEAGRQAIKRLEFQEHSTIFVQLEGEGATASFADCKNAGRVELREFKYQGVEFIDLTTDIEIQGRKQVFRNVEGHPREGHGSVKEVLIDFDADIVKLTGVKAKLDPVPITSFFARKVAEHISKYRFGPRTEVEIDGVIGMHGPKLDNYAIRFDADGAAANYTLWERDYSIKEPTGTVTILGPQLTFDIKGKLYGGPLSAKGHVMFGKGTRYDVKLKAEEFRRVILGKDLPIQNLNVEITSRDDQSPFDISGKVLGGAMTLRGELLSQGKSDSYRGELQLNGMPFQQFASVYAPGNESAGDITGHFNFSGKLNDWKALRGSGVLIILNGNLYALPVLGPLTPLLGSLLPSLIKDYNVAKEANCNFTVSDGFIVTNDFEALTSAFKLVADGRIDFINDDIDFTLQARVRGLPGLVLRPVSELLEYKGVGSLSKPSWHPHLLGLAKDRNADERKPPTKQELESAQREAQRAIEMRERLRRMPNTKGSR